MTTGHKRSGFVRFCPPLTPVVKPSFLYTICMGDLHILHMILAAQMEEILHRRTFLFICKDNLAG